jgi:hypothetical protein
MKPFVLTQKLKYKPFPAEYAIQNEKTQKEYVIPFSIKHVQDWPETALEEFNRIGSKWMKIDSLIKKQGKNKLTKEQAAQSFIISTSMNRLIGANGIIEEDGKRLWAEELPPHVKALYVEAWKNYLPDAELNEDKEEE